MIEIRIPAREARVVELDAGSAGSSMELEVLEDLVVALSACPQDLAPCNAFNPTPSRCGSCGRRERPRTRRGPARPATRPVRRAGAGRMSAPATSELRAEVVGRAASPRRRLGRTGGTPSAQPGSMGG